MEELKIRISGVRAAASEEKAISDNLEGIADEVQSIKNHLRSKIIVKGALNERLKHTIEAIDKEKDKLKKQSDKLYQISDYYERTEKRICTGDFRVDGLNITDFIKGIIPFGPCVSIADFWDVMKDNDIDPALGIKDYSSKKLDDLISDKTKSEINNPMIENEDGTFTTVDLNDPKQKKKWEESQLDKVATIASISRKKEESLISRENSGDNGWAKGSYEWSVLQAEACAEAYAGLYATGPDGERKFAPGFGAEIGVGVSGFHAEAEGQLGSDTLGAYGEAEFSAGKADMKLGADVGLFGKDGKVNPQVHVAASAEAIAAEVSGTVGAVVAGTKIGATGKVNLGVGAHADVGFKDGRLSLDLGASLGVGVSVKLDIDMSGTIDAVSSFAKSAWDFFGF